MLHQWLDMIKVSKVYEVSFYWVLLSLTKLLKPLEWPITYSYAYGGTIPDLSGRRTHVPYARIISRLTVPRPGSVSCVPLKLSLLIIWGHA